MSLQATLTAETHLAEGQYLLEHQILNVKMSLITEQDFQDQF
jgi:hypothetical protein